MITEIKSYTDDQGKSVKSYVPVLRCFIAETRYEGTVGIQTPRGIMPMDFPFPEDYTLEKCFEDFEEVAKREVNSQMEEAKKAAAERNRIITPGTAIPPQGDNNIIQMR